MSKRSSRRNPGEGRVHKRKSDGRWCASLTIGYHGGKRIDKWVYGATKRDVLEKRETIKQQHRQGMLLCPNGQTVAQFLQAWLEDYVSHKKHKTYTSYEETITRYINPAIGSIKLHALTPKHVDSMVSSLNNQGLAPRTVQYAAQVLSRALNRAVRHEELPRNVVEMVDNIPTVPRRVIKTLTEEMARRFLQAVAGDRLEPLYRLALGLGMRRGELLALPWSAVDVQQATVTIREGKTSASRRVLHLPESLVHVLRQHREYQDQERAAQGTRWQEHGLVFPSSIGTPISPSNLVRHFRKVFKPLLEADIERLEHEQQRALDMKEREAYLEEHMIRFHDLRHSFATLLLGKGVSMHVVKDILGHTSISTTIDIYGHVLPATQRESLRTLETIIG